MVNVTSVGFQTACTSLQEEASSFEVKGGDGKPVRAFWRGGSLCFDNTLSTYSPTPADRGISSSEASRSVSLVHPAVCHTFMPTPVMGHNLSINQHVLHSSDQRAYFLDTQYLENRHVGPQGRFHGRQLIVQPQPVVPRVGWGGSSCGGVIRVVDAGQAILPLSDLSQRSVKFYDAAGGVIPTICSSLSPYSVWHQGSSGIDHNSAARCTVGSIAAKPDLAEKGWGSPSSQESSQAVVESSGAPRQISGDHSSKRNRRSRRKGRAIEQRSAIKPPGQHQSAKSVRIKEDLEIRLSKIDGMKKQLRLLQTSKEKDDLGIFVGHLKTAVEYIEKNRGQHVWFSLKDYQLQLLVDARARLYQSTRGCPKEERKIDLATAEGIFIKLDPLIARAFEGFLDKINEGISEVLFDALDLLLTDSILGVNFGQVDLGKLTPFVSKIPLAMSADLAYKIARNFDISSENKQDLVVQIYEGFIRRLKKNGCVSMQKDQVRYCFSQFISAFFNIPLYLFHESKRSGSMCVFDRGAWLSHLDASQRKILSEYRDLRGRQLAGRRSKLEKEIIDEGDLSQSDEVSESGCSGNRESSEASSDLGEAQIRLSDEKMSDRACELFCSGNTAAARELYTAILKGKDVKPLMVITCELALIEVEFKELGFDRDYLSFRKIIRKCGKIFDDYRNVCSRKRHRLETDARELEKASDEADEKIKQFYHKWSAPITSQCFTIDQLRERVASISEELSDDDLGKLSWYVKEVKSLHERMGDILPLLELSTYRLDQAFDDRQSWLSSIPRRGGGEERVEKSSPCR